MTMLTTWLVRHSDERLADQQRVRARRDTEAGFTLVELIVVLGILALVAGVAGPQVLGYLGRAKTETARVQLSAISSALELYALDMGGYPPPDVGLTALVRAPAGASRWNGPYLKKAEALLDPWGKPYGYRLVSANGPAQVFSLGRDGAPGGGGESQDVAN